VTASATWPFQRKHDRFNDARYLPQYLRTRTTWQRNQTAKESAATLTAIKFALANPTLAANAVSEITAATVAPSPMPSAGRAMMFMPFGVNTNFMALAYSEPASSLRRRTRTVGKWPMLPVLAT
jgi:hypothetical protein